MGSADPKDLEFENLLSRFARFIRIHVQKYNPQKYGLDPDDICQDIRIKIWKLLHSEKIIRNYPSYIKKIVNSSVIDQLRRLKREEDIFILERKRQVEEHEYTYNPEATRLRNMREAVGQAVETLLESRRRVVKLYLLNMNIDEIAAHFRWSRDKTRNLLYRGLADLKKILRQWDIEYEDRPR